MKITAKILSGLNEAGLFFLGLRQCAYVEDDIQQCTGIVKTNGHELPGSPYGDFCGWCLEHIWGKGE